MLDERLVGQWQAIQDGDPAFASPFLGPAWARLVATSGRPVEVGLWQRDGEAVGFFAFERIGHGRGRPVGTVFCDYQAVVIRPDVAWDVETLLRGVRLRRWDFDHLLAWQAPFRCFHQREDFSPFIDLSAGFDAYRRRLNQDGRRQLSQAARRARQIERELGPLSFAIHEPELPILERLLALKSAQWARSGWPGRFQAEWERKLIEGVMNSDTPAFAGLLSVLRAGKRIVALHLGPRSRTVWHYWITAYDPEAARFSPGIVLLEQMARSAAALGLAGIDLGKGDFRYKRRLMTDGVPLAEGRATRSGVPPGRWEG